MNLYISQRRERAFPAIEMWKDKLGIQVQRAKK